MVTEQRWDILGWPSLGNPRRWGVRILTGFFWLVVGGNLLTATSPVLWKEIPIPDAFTQTALIGNEELSFGGDIRVGDLDGDGDVELVVFRSTDLGMKPCFIGAFELDGTAMWRIGKAGDQPARPGSVTLYDFDGDGQDEVLHFWHDGAVDNSVKNMADVMVQLRRGDSGELIGESRPELFAESEGEGANWVHQRLLIANLSGHERASEFVVKLGERLVAFDQSLEVLWHYRIPWNEYSKCSAYIPAVGDIDGDGRDEITGGYYLVDDDGGVMWEQQLGRNMDSVAIVPWDNGVMRVIASGGGFVLDAAGHPLLHLGEEIVPHGQEVRVGDFRADVPGPEMIIRWNGHRHDAMLVSQQGEILVRFKLNDSPNHTGLEAVYWRGLDASPLIYNGGMLWDGHGKPVASFPELSPEPVGEFRRGWYHCIPLDIMGDNAEEVLLYNPWERVVRIFRDESTDPSAVKPFRSTERQFNVRLMD